MQEHNTESKTIGRYNRKTQPKNTVENENRAHNNRIDTDWIGKAVFSPQSHEKIHR